MIDYIEVRGKADRELIGIIDNSKSVIWHSVYFGVGDFEIFCKATEENLALLQEDNYITRPFDDNIGIIESIEITQSVTDGAMVVASGRFAKSILDRRHIYNLNGKTNKPTILRGNVEAAARSLVTNNAISCSFDSARNISSLQLGPSAGITKVIVDSRGAATRKQVSFENLLDYSDGLLEEYDLGAKIVLNGDNMKLQYIVHQGADRSNENEEGNEPIIFSPEFDNLIESNYLHDSIKKKTAALIGGEGEGLDRFYSMIRGSESGIDRRETWVDASSLNRKYTDDHEEEQTYTDSEYKAMLDALGKQTLAELVAQDGFEGTIDFTNGQWRYNEDYYLGDIVTVQDKRVGMFVSARLTEIVETQDENGYSILPTLQIVRVVDEPVPQLMALLQENGYELTTENGDILTLESSPAGGFTLSADEGSKKISELPESTDVYDGCCMPIVTNGETKKVYFSMLSDKVRDEIEAISDASIDEICV